MINIEAIDSIEEIASDIQSDVQSVSKKALSAQAKLIPRFIEQTFLLAGERGGMARWMNLTPRSISYRQTGWGQWNQGINVYVMPGSGGATYTPLFDTGHLMKSFTQESHEDSDTELAVLITSTTPDLGLSQEEGTATTPDGNPVWPRPHMFIVVGEDTDQLGLAYEEAWEESV